MARKEKSMTDSLEAYTFNGDYSADREDEMRRNGTCCFRDSIGYMDYCCSGHRTGMPCCLTMDCSSLSCFLLSTCIGI